MHTNIIINYKLKALQPVLQYNNDDSSNTYVWQYSLAWPDH